MSYEYALPALLLVISNLLKTGLTTKKGIWDTAYDFFSGLPVDLTFVAVSVILLSSDTVDRNAMLWGFLCFFVGAFQTAFIYKGQLILYDDRRPKMSLLLLGINILITYFVFYAIYQWGSNS